MNEGASIVTVHFPTSWNSPSPKLMEKSCPYVMRLSSMPSIDKMEGRRWEYSAARYGGENASKLSSVGYSTPVKLYLTCGLLPPTRIFPSGSNVAAEWYILGIVVGLSTVNLLVGLGSSGRYITGFNTGSAAHSHPAVPRAAPFRMITSPLGRSSMSSMTRPIGISSITHFGSGSVTRILPHDFAAVVYTPFTAFM